MNLLQTIIPIFYDSSSDPVDGEYVLATAIAIEICLIAWFVIYFFKRRYYSTIKERLFYDECYDFPNAPTGCLIGFNAFILFLVLVAFIVKLLR